MLYSHNVQSYTVFTDLLVVRVKLAIPIQGVKIWLDKEMRTGLKLRFDAEKASGSLNTTLWYGTIKVPLEVNTAIGLLLQVELYASDCYDTTQQHIANVMNLTTIEEVTEYDFTANYPEKLVF